MKVKKVIIDGQEVEVTICPPSRRKAASSIQRPRYQRNPAGSKHAAKEKEQIQ